MSGPVISGAVSWASEHAQSVFDSLDGAFRGDGIVVAVTAIDADGPVLAASEGMPADGRFEIGSLTKTMTATLLACLVGDGTVALGDPIGRWLDAGPNAGITLEELATHTSGLPRLAPNQPTFDPIPTGSSRPSGPRKGCAPRSGRRGRPVSARTSATSCWGWQSSGPAAAHTRTCCRSVCWNRWRCAARALARPTAAPG